MEREKGIGKGLKGKEEGRMGEKGWEEDPESTLEKKNSDYELGTL